MFSLRSMMALLAVLALSAKMAESATPAPSVCSTADVGKDFCLNCKTPGNCVAAGSPPVPGRSCTNAGEACTVQSGLAKCKPIAETECSCGMAAQCDAYDPDSVLVCLAGGETIINDCGEQGATCVEGGCFTLATTSSPGELCLGASDGYVVITPLCTIAVYCLSGVSVGTSVPCEPGTYFDVDGNGCLPHPIVPCAGCDDVACPDKSDCSKYYTCYEGVFNKTEHCSGASPDFDIVTKACVATGTGTCTANDGCTYGFTTITETTTTSKPTTRPSGKR